MLQSHTPPAATRAHPAPTTRCWDVYCRVVDNFGDVGVCARLARQLARQGLPVRLFIDDASALAWMAPQGLAGAQVHPWPADDAPAVEPGGVVIEAAFRTVMADVSALMMMGYEHTNVTYHNEWKCM